MWDTAVYLDNNLLYHGRGDVSVKIARIFN